MQLILLLVLLLIDLLVSYLLAGSLNKKLMANGNGYSTVISILVGLLSFAAIFIGGGAIIFLAFPFER